MALLVKHQGLVVYFVVALLVAMLVLGGINQSFHNRSERDSYKACLASQQIASNQRRVILAVLALAYTEGVEHERPNDPAIDNVKKALALVPKFDCRK